MRKPEVMNIICNNQGLFWSSSDGWADFDSADRFSTKERNEIGDYLLLLFDAYWATDVTTILRTEH